MNNPGDGAAAMREVYATAVNLAAYFHHSRRRVTDRRYSRLTAEDNRVMALVEQNAERGNWLEGCLAGVGLKEWRVRTIGGGGSRFTVSLDGDQQPLLVQQGSQTHPPVPITLDLRWLLGSNMRRETTPSKRPLGTARVLTDRQERPRALIMQKRPDSKPRALVVAFLDEHVWDPRAPSTLSGGEAVYTEPPLAPAAAQAPARAVRHTHQHTHTHRREARREAPRHTHRREARREAPPPDPPRAPLREREEAAQEDPGERELDLDLELEPGEPYYSADELDLDLELEPGEPYYSADELDLDLDLELESESNTPRRSDLMLHA